MAEGCAVGTYYVIESVMAPVYIQSVVEEV